MTLNLPDTLLSEAMRNSSVTTKTALIVDALEEYIRKRKRDRLMSLKGKDLFSIGYDPEQLRDEEEAERGAR
jgi:hypothetical protein